ncbi:hypothetical protein FEM48_Zijuj03G0192200 [Ziziphus jujuba var. spinosa]|uniref:LRAT domain-containing protein n=1 Tax=Ziziphus jujuba var. spinosa TaxID=714518 RepID=A0A978VS44_ZIZJJ|nr:hypothetical protein FEM48_Zijuj03G0192200 [Ziziphus jujuba var. spinosa]
MVFGAYDLLSNNHETFAVYCKTGISSSVQAICVEATRETIYAAFMKRPLSLTKTLKWGAKPILGLESRLEALKMDMNVHESTSGGGWLAAAALHSIHITTKSLERIYVKENNKDRVIHLNRKPKTGENCRGEQQAEEKKGGGIVVKTCLDCFLDDHSLFLNEYQVSIPNFLVQVPGTCTTGPANDPCIVFDRAYKMHKTNGFGTYDLLNNNCETFVVYCTTEISYSVQAMYMEIAAKTILADWGKSQSFMIALANKLELMFQVKKSVSGSSKDKRLVESGSSKDKVVVENGSW